MTVVIFVAVVFSAKTVTELELRFQIGISVTFAVLICTALGNLHREMWYCNNWVNSHSKDDNLEYNLHVDRNLKAT